MGTPSEPSDTEGATVSRPTHGPPAAPAADSPPVSPVPPTSPGRRLGVGQRVGTAVAALLSLGGALLAWLTGIVVFTGCFIKCDDSAADPVGGTLLFSLAAALVVVAAVGTQLTCTGSTRHTRTTVMTATGVAAAAVVFTVLSV